MSFPDISNIELHKIERDFYRNFCDTIVETVRSYHMSSNELNSRISYENFELLEKLIAANKSFVGVLGHMGNWEWIVLDISKKSMFPIYALYQPPSSKSTEQWLKNNRSRFGAKLLPSKSIRTFLKDIVKTPAGIGLLADQGPVNVEKAFWTRFLHQDTAVYKGTEKLARQNNLAVVYLNITKPKRGHYHVRFDLITDNPNAFDENEISKVHTQLLEQNIKQQPSIWLWSHRRWKRSHLKPKLNTNTTSNI